MKPAAEFHHHVRLLKHVLAQLHRNYTKAKGPESIETFRAFIYLAPRPGLEPGTCGLTVRRSTN